MKNRSKLNKGLRLVNYLVNVFRQTIDDKAYKIFGSGAGLDKNDLRLPSFNVEIEAKNAETINLIKDWEQTKRQMTTGNMGVLAVRNPKKPEFEEVLIVLEANDFIDLLGRTKNEVKVISNQDDKLKWKLVRLKETANEVIKLLE